VVPFPTGLRNLSLLQLVHGSTEPPIQWVAEPISLNLNTHPFPIQRLRTNEATTLFPHIHSWLAQVQVAFVTERSERI